MGGRGALSHCGHPWENTVERRESPPSRLALYFLTRKDLSSLFTISRSELGRRLSERSTSAGVQADKRDPFSLLPVTHYFLLPPRTSLLTELRENWEAGEWILSALSTVLGTKDPAPTPSAQPQPQCVHILPPTFIKCLKEEKNTFFFCPSTAKSILLKQTTK